MNTPSEKGLKTKGLKQSKDAAETRAVSHQVLTPMFTGRVQESTVTRSAKGTS